MKAKSFTTLLLFLLFSHTSYVIGGDTQTEDNSSAASEALAGNFEAGEERYKKSCINCHGAAGKGVASYPKISGKDIPYTTKMLETYRAGTKVGPNSSLMIMMAKPLTDEEIAHLAVYLKDAEP
jgi:cytochrome c553